jgi:hypothetical protein
MKISCTKISQNEVRNARTNNNQTNNNHSTTTTLTVNNATTSQPVAIAAACSNQSTNVLRTLTNTFVPNIHHTPQTNHSFG